MFGWIHIINSKDDYERIWKAIGEYPELHLGNFIIIDGNLLSKDGRVFGKEGEILAAIISLTFKREVMERLIKSGEIDPSKTILDTELDPEEFIKNEAGAILIKKIIKDFEKPSEFRNFLSKYGLKI